MSGKGDLKKILVIGSGPIRIGQGCEFDYSGTQACQALRDCGHEVVLINSNPATIMTDPESADRVYIEPLTSSFVRKILEIERPDALLPTMGGQVALNLFLDLHRSGDLERLGVTVLGVKAKTVETAEDRALFKKLVTGLGYQVVRGGMATNLEDAEQLAETLRFPLIVRASFTLGGGGGGIARDRADLFDLVRQARAASKDGEIAIEESIVNWKEYELEVMRDRSGNFVVVCGIENVNPMGVHTGDSITVAPCMTLTDREFQLLRDMARHIFEAIGMETGGANIQFAVHPETGEIVVIEMNPRVSRSSALVSKATGYPIARLSAKLALGYTLDELRNEITDQGPAAFEPAIDYVAVKIPRWDFQRFGGNDTLGIAMKSVGEVLAFGATFKDAFQKAWRSLEMGFEGWPGLEEIEDGPLDDSRLSAVMAQPTPRLFPAIKTAFRHGWQIDRIYGLTRIGMWFLRQLEEIVRTERALIDEAPGPRLLRRALSQGFTRGSIAELTKLAPVRIETLLREHGIRPTFKMVDTCSGEFVARTPYYFKTWEWADDNRIGAGKKVVILGAGPNRIGQGIEFDYACVHAVMAAREFGYEAILVNCNPETVSTDYLVSDKLYIEPLTGEDVLDLLRAENPDGVLLQFGGQSPLKIAAQIDRAGYRILGSPWETIEGCEDRKRFGALLGRLGIDAPPWGAAMNRGEARTIAEKLGFPLLVRPSYVIGGQGMGLVGNFAELDAYLDNAARLAPEHPVLIDRYLEGAHEYDIDLLCDGRDIYVPAILEHIEEAGIHSGDSACLTPPVDLTGELAREMVAIVRRLALSLEVVGILNIQLAVWHGRIYVLEVNPRSSRTVPFVAKAVGIPLAKYAAQLALGRSLADLDLPPARLNGGYAAKAPVFPFQKFPGTMPYPGPEMRSLGEVMGRGETAREALAKAYIAAGLCLTNGDGVLCLRVDFKKTETLRALRALGPRVMAPPALIEPLRRAGIQASALRQEDWSGQCSELLAAGKIGLVLDMTMTHNAPGKHQRDGSARIAEIAVNLGVPLATTPRSFTVLLQILAWMEQPTFSLQPLSTVSPQTAVLA